MPFTDANGWTDPSRYLTIRTGNLNVNDPGTTDLIGRAQNGLVGYSWNGSGWSPLPAGPDGPDPGADTFFADSNCGTPSCYGLFRVGHVHGGPFGKVQMVGRTARGVDVLTYQGGAKSGTWFMADESADAQPPARPNGLFGDATGGSGLPDSPARPTAWAQARRITRRSASPTSLGTEAMRSLLAPPTVCAP